MTPDRIAALLPAVYQETRRAGGLLDAMLAAMSGLHEPTENMLGSLDQLVDPRQTDNRFLPMLAFWLDLDAYLDWPGGYPGLGQPSYPAGPGRLRALVAAAPGLRRARGTAAALADFLETATGVPGFTVTNTEDTRFAATITVPPAARRHADLVDRIVERERPAFVTYQILFAADPASDPKPPEPDHG